MKPKGCEPCPLYKSGLGFVQANNPDKVILLIQGEAPGREELQVSKAFVGASGQWLRQIILKQAGINDKEVIFDNTIRCLLGGKSGAYPTGETKTEAESWCGQYKVWDKFPTKPLLLVGAKAIGQYMDDDRVSRWHGNIINANGRVIGATYHPAAVMRDPNLLPLVVQEIRNLIRASRNPEVLKRPKVYKGVFNIDENKFTFDLEWNAAGKIIICGISFDGSFAYSTFDPSAVEQVRDAIYRGATVCGHNIVSADLPRLNCTAEWIRDNASRIRDTMIMAHLVHPHFSELGLLGLSDMVKYYMPVTEWKDDKADPLEYNGRDAAYNARLLPELERDLRLTEQNHLLVKDTKLAAMAVKMNEIGIRLDKEELERYANEEKKTRDDYKDEFPFNPNSPKQIQEWAASVGIKLADTKFLTLKKYEGKNPIFDELIAYREDSKSLSTWFPLEEDKDGIVHVTEEWIHPWLSIVGTKVARWSGSNPNTQNIPGGGPRILPGGAIKHMPNLRRFFRSSDDDHELFSLDYSQLEDWTVAIESGDQQLLADLQAGLDIHALTAKAFVKSLYNEDREITKDSPERFRGKQTNHQAKYLITPAFLSFQMFGNRTAANVRLAETLLAAYFNRYKGVAAWHRRIAQQMSEGDFTVRNRFGRRFRIYAAQPLEGKYKTKKEPFYGRLIAQQHERTKRACHSLGCSNGAELLNQRALDVWEYTGIAPSLIIHDEAVWNIPKGSDGERFKSSAIAIFTAKVPELENISVPVGKGSGRTYGEL